MSSNSDKLVVEKYTATQEGRLVDFFFEILSQHPDYISHGEIQMGIASKQGEITPNAKKQWLEYLHRQIEGECQINVATINSEIVGFSIAGIECDGDAPYGVIYDMSVTHALRGRGIGNQLMQEILAYFEEQGVESAYLESGVNNSTAHNFFEKYGFKTVSKIFARL